MEEELVVGLVETLQIVRNDPAFIIPSPLPDTLKKSRCACLKINHEVRDGNMRVEQVINLFVQGKLAFLKRDRGKDAILGKKVVADRALRENVHLRERLELAVAGQQKENLCLEGELLRILVELF